MFKRVLSLALAFVFTLSLAACGNNTAGTQQAKTEAPKAEAAKSEAPAATPAAKSESKVPQGDIVIAVVPQQLGNPVFLDAKEGAEKAAKTLGVKLEWAAPVKADAPSQVEVVEGLIAKKVKGIAISCNHPEALKAVINKAVDAGIQVSTFDADSPDSKRAFYAGTMNYEAGKICGQKLVEITKGKGTVALLTGNLGHFALEARINGFKEAIKGTEIKIVTTQACEDDLNKAIEQVEAYTKSNPALDSWFFVGGWPFFAPPQSLNNLRNWKKNPGKTIVTMDSFYPMLKYFDENMINVAVGQDFEAMGYKSVENLVKLIKGEQIAGKTIDTGVSIVTPENYKEYKASKKPW